MNRRLYFLVPGRAEALSAIKDLSSQGINPERIQVLADKRTRTDGLTTATDRQKNDAESLLEKALWNVNLVSFATALGCFIFLLITQHLNWWLLLPSSVMAANFIIGLNLSNLPQTRLGEFRDALAHGEILLQVEVPENRTRIIEQCMHRHQPVATVDGSAWGSQAFGH
jgi:hypothetical protein